MIKVNKVQNARPGREALYTVTHNGDIIGLLSKFRDTKTDKHPWKAYKGYGHDATFLRSFYLEEGGKEAATKAVVCEVLT